MRLTAIALASILAACGGGAAATHESSTPPADTHPIHLARTLAVGYVWGEITQYAMVQRQTVRTGDTVVQDTTTQRAIELAGDYTILALGPDGEPSRVRLSIDHMAADTGNGAVVVTLPPVVVIERGSPGTIAGENGEGIADDALALLREVVPNHTRPVDDDAVFGTREPQAVGATWPIDPVGAARGLAALHITVDPANVRGSTTLVTTGTESGVPFLGLHTEIVARHVSFPGLPPGSVEQRADVAAAVEVALPVDTSIVPLREAEESAVDIEVLVPTEGGGQATVDIAIQERVVHQRTLLQGR